MMKFAAPLLLLFVAVAVSCVLSAPITYPNRVYHGWSVESLASNRFDSTGLFIDSGRVVQTVPSSSTGGGSSSQELFNLTSNALDLQLMTPARFGHSWIFGYDNSGWISQTYLMYVNLLTQKILFNISTNDFRPHGGWVSNLAVDGKDNVYAVNSNNVWVFNSRGQQINYFQLKGAGSWLVDIDIDSSNNLWVLEDYNYTSQSSRLLQYSLSGELIYSNKLQFNDLKVRDFLVNIAVNSSGWAHITAFNESRVLTWSTVNNVRGADIPLTINHYPNGRSFTPMITLLNDSTVIVSAYGSPDISVLNVNDARRSYVVSSPTPQILSPGLMVSAGQSLIVNSQTSLVAVSPVDGSITADFGVEAYLYGLTSDKAGNVYVSNDDWRVAPSFSVDVYDSKGNLNRHMIVNTSGPIVINDDTQQIYIVNNMRWYNVSIDVYTVKYGAYVSSIQLPKTVSHVSDIQRFSVDGQTGYIIVDDYQNTIAAYYDKDNTLFYSFATRDFRPERILIDPSTQYSYVLGADYANNGLAQIRVYGTTGQITEILTGPPGWNTGSLFGMTQDSQGTLFASCTSCNAIFAFPRSRSAPVAESSPRPIIKIVNTEAEAENEAKIGEIEKSQQVKPEFRRVAPAKLSRRHERSRRRSESHRG